MSEIQQSSNTEPSTLHPAKAFAIDLIIGVGLAVVLLIILFFAGGGSNFIYIDF